MTFRNICKSEWARARSRAMTVLAIAIVLFGSISTATAEEIAVVVNPGNTTDSLDKAALARIFLGRASTFPNGLSAVPVTGDEANDTRIAFEHNVLGKNTSQMKAYWAKQMFSGQGRPPATVGSDDEVKARVASDVDAIGYIPASLVDDSVKVVYRQQ